MFREAKYFTIQETASILSVSGATVRNWIKHEYLRPVGDPSGILFNTEEVHKLKDMIRSGLIRRLNRRANKATALKSFIPDEYLNDKSFRKTIEYIASHISSKRIDLERAFFILSLRRLFQEGICSYRNADEFFRSGFYLPHNLNLSRELAGWHSTLGDFRVTDVYTPLLKIDLPPQRDVLGLIYQSLMLEGDKSRNGCYYTPDRIAQDIACRFTNYSRVMDPCCGTGQFLLAFALRSGNPENLYGYDIDGLAVRIARINLMLEFKNLDFSPRIYHRNFFLDDIRDTDGSAAEFDVITTNPPWGLHFGRDVQEKLAVLYPEIRSFESFSYMLKRSIDLLSVGGSLSFILPESILSVERHGDIRKYILEHTRIENIIHLGRVFKNVFTPAIRLDLKKDRKKTRLLFINKKRFHMIGQNRFMRNGDYVFDIHINSHDEKILEKVHGLKHATLKDNADWALGIVTGNNERYLCNEKIDEDYELIYRGRDVDRYVFREAASYVKFTPEKFQQTAPEFKYRAAEKLVYRFISKNLIFAYDNRRRLTLNSANVLIPIFDNYPIKVILALFNSLVYQFIFQKKFFSIKVLRAQLEQLPLPLWDEDALGRIASMADGILASSGSMEEMDEFIMDLFGLNQGDRNHIRRSVR